MNAKQVGGIVALILGVVLIIFSFYEKSRMANAQADIQQGTGFFHNPVTDTVGGAMEGRISQYNAPIMFCLIAGIVLVIAGGATALCCRCKKKR